MAFKKKKNHCQGRVSNSAQDSLFQGRLSWALCEHCCVQGSTPPLQDNVFFFKLKYGSQNFESHTLTQGRSINISVKHRKSEAALSKFIKVAPFIRSIVMIKYFPGQWRGVQCDALTIISHWGRYTSVNFSSVSCHMTSLSPITISPQNKGYFCRKRGQQIMFS